MTDDPIRELIDSAPIAEDAKADLRNEWARRQALAAGDAQRETSAVLADGYCPSCGGWPLFVGDGGHLTCSQDVCPEPDAADRVLADPETEHIVDFRAREFTARHPLIERVDDRLMRCELGAHLAALPGPPVPPGRYRVRPNDDDPVEPWAYERLAGADAEQPPEASS